jgi:tetratricopeptide (TPR) repeat protein
VALELERPSQARQAFRDAAARADALGDRRRSAEARKGLGLVALELGYLNDARVELEEAARFHVASGDRAGLGSVLVHLGTVHARAGRVKVAFQTLRRARRMLDEIGHPEGVAAARHRLGRLLRRGARTNEAIRELAAASEQLQRLGLPDRTLAMRELGYALADAGAERAARITLARADRGEPASGTRRIHRVLSRGSRVQLALASGDLARARVLADAALRQAARTTGHEARIEANLADAAVAVAAGDAAAAASAADTVIAFAREQSDLLAAAAAERILAGLAARAGRHDEARTRAHRAARAYTGRGDTGDGPALLLATLATAGGPLAKRYARAARRCCARLEAAGFRAPHCG